MMRIATLLFVAVSCAGCLVGTTAPPLDPGINALPAGNVAAREGVVVNQLTMIKRAEEMSLASGGHYVSMDELVKGGGLNVAPEQLGYTIDLTATGDTYTVIAVPNEYGPKGKRSFFMDQTGQIRGDDHMGGAASATDPPVS